MDKSSDQTLKAIVVATYGALLFAVPSAGMDVEALATMVGDLPARTTLNELDARIGQSLRRRQHRDFCEAFPFEDSKLARFYELHESPTVEKASQPNPSFPWMCQNAIKFTPPNANSYRTPPENGLGLASPDNLSTSHLLPLEGLGKLTTNLSSAWKATIRPLSNYPITTERKGTRGSGMSLRNSLRLRSR